MHNLLFNFHKHEFDYFHLARDIDEKKKLLFHRIWYNLECR